MRNPALRSSIAPPNRLGSRAAWKAVNHRPNRRLPVPPRLVTLVVLVALLAGGVAIYLSIGAPVLLVNGIADGQVVRRNQLADLAVVAAVQGTGAGGVTMQVDGKHLPVEKAGALFVGRPSGLTAGDHVLSIEASGLPGKSTSLQRRFTVDLSGPTLVLPTRIGAPAGKPVILSGVALDATSLTVDGRAVPIVHGRFDVGLEAADRPVAVTATDANGITDQGSVTMTTQDMAPTQPAMRAVHLTAQGWAEPGLREPVLQLAREGRIDAVELDIKDEDGIVGYASKVPLAVESGAASGLYDAAAIQELKGLGVRVVGRIVCFLDPKLAAYALASGKTGELILDQAGTSPYNSVYGSVAFTNFADPVVQRYNIDLATEAVQLGFNEILYDYVRRPDGAWASMTVPGLTVDPAIAVAGFVRAAHTALAGTGAKLGISVFGISATRPEPIAQDIRLLLPWVDYISPMVYPSHWGKGEYGLANPNANPYEIVKRSLKDFHDLSYGTGVAVMPWLQAFSAGGITYGPDMVGAQIRAAAETGSPGFLLWNSGSTYDPQVLPMP